MQPSLLIMAAGMGSRYGGLKQMEALGPGGAALLDYSVYDAIRAGFGKVVFVIRHEIEDDFKKIVGKKWESRIPVRYVFQELGMVPEGFRVPGARKKPWGTGHAIWVAQGAVQEPFAAINADDYYGRHSFKGLGKFLGKIHPAAPPPRDSGKTRTVKTVLPTYGMMGFELKRTLSEHGAVSRGVCRLGPGKTLREVVERTHIEKSGKRVHFLDGEGKRKPLQGRETVSMNMWGFTPAIFGQLGEKFKRFLGEKGQEEKSEFLIPRVVDELIQEKKARVKVLATRDQWFGVTYPEDREMVRESVHRLVAQKHYPERPWK